MASFLEESALSLILEYAPGGDLFKVSSSAPCESP